MTTADTQDVVTPADSRNGEAGRLCVQRLVRPDLWETCQECGGYGWRGGTVYHPRFVKCSKCNGRGDVPRPNIVLDQRTTDSKECK